MEYRIVSHVIMLEAPDGKSVIPHHHPPPPLWFFDSGISIDETVGDEGA